MPDQLLIQALAAAQVAATVVMEGGASQITPLLVSDTVIYFGQQQAEAEEDTGSTQQARIVLEVPAEA